MDQFTPLQLSLQLFCPIVNLWHKLDLKERATINEIKWEPEQKQRGEGGVEFPRSLMLQLAWFPDFTNLSFGELSLSKAALGCVNTKFLQLHDYR